MPVSTLTRVPYRILPLIAAPSFPSFATKADAATYEITVPDLSLTGSFTANQFGFIANQDDVDITALGLHFNLAVDQENTADFSIIARDAPLGFVHDELFVTVDGIKTDIGGSV